MRVPVATYRLQFNSAFGFKAAKDIVPYLDALGISDIYASPIFQARTGSAHGYDVVNHNELNPELGGREGFLELVGALKDRGMGFLQDMVPNHMAYSIENPMMADILERGESSEYHSFFDIDWSYHSAGLRGKILAPFLGGHYEDALEKGEIRLIFSQSGFAIDYNGLLFPLRLESYPRVLGMEEGSEYQERNALLGAVVLGRIREMILNASGSPDYFLELKRQLWELYIENRAFEAFLDSRLKAFNGMAGRPESFDLLDSLLRDQIFLLSFWKAASQEINYRRFFTINDLISLRIERKEVFDHVHSMLFDMVGRGEVTGIRVDHIDGLYNPKEYLERLRERLREHLRENVSDIYVIVEKILGWNENLPSWPVQGTTGYDFLNYLNGIFCNKENAFEFDYIYSSFTGIKSSYDDVVYEKKRLMLERYMGGDVDNLVYQLKALAEKDRHGRDLTLSGLRAGLEEFMIGLSVYRMYMDSESLSDQDRFAVQEATKKARRRRPELAKEIDYLERILIRSKREFAMRLSQFTGPLMAKGFEDTVLYCYNRLISLNEVGGSPERFGTSPEEFHSFNAVRAERWPKSMNATSTHDTKRGEDARARISVISEIPAEWAGAVERWRRMNEPKRRDLNGCLVPDRNEEYLLYQSLIGALPLNLNDLDGPVIAESTEMPDEQSTFLERAKGYIIKALREAKTHSDWMYPDSAYEDAFTAFFRDIMGPSTDFIEDFAAFQRDVALYGMQNSLSQTLLKITSPGVPDFYQGTELWDFSFVDPDNRRAVDFDMRMSSLEEIKIREDVDLPGLIRELMAKMADGRIKLFLIHRALMARRANADLFRLGRYLPLKAVGVHSDKIIAFARVHEGSWALALAQRFPASRDGSWGNTSVVLPKVAPENWSDAIAGKKIAGRRLSLEDIFEHLPVALLMGSKG